MNRYLIGEGYVQGLSKNPKFTIVTSFSATIEKFGSQGEKSGWTYLKIPASIAGKLFPGRKKSFRVKGYLDQFYIKGVALLPMGEGDFIMALNGPMRKGIKKNKGAVIKLQLEIDPEEPLPPAELLECLKEDKEALQFFYSLPAGHRNYFLKWIDAAKTGITRQKRISATVIAMERKMDYATMLRAQKQTRII